MKKKLLFSFAAAAFSFTVVNAQNVNIPDANFKNYLVNEATINTNGDTEIQVSEASAFTGTINCSGLNIADLTGIEAFTSLTQLWCGNNQLTTLDLSQNTALTQVSAFSNQLTSITLSASITVLYCNLNQLTSLDVSNNTGLTELGCYGNQLTSLDVSNNTNLQYLYCEDNMLTSLDVSNNTSLIELTCQGNNLTSLDVTQNTALEYFDCNSNQLTALDMTQNTAMLYFYCDNNQLTTLDLSSCTVIEEIQCQDNTLSFLNIANGNNTNITDFDATNNPNVCIQVDDVIYAGTNFTAVDSTASFSTNCFASVNENSIENDFSTYPNPAKNTLNIYGEHNNATYSIFNITGKTVLTGKLTKGNNIVDLSTLDNGVYFVKITVDNSSLTKRIIKQ